MVAIIIGDIINSRQIKDQGLWLDPLKKLFKNWGNSPKEWEIFRGDNFQLQISDPTDALLVVLQIKSLIKSLATGKSNRLSPIDVRIAIGIGDIEFKAKRISESNGNAFVRAGEKFEKLKSEKLTIAVKTDWQEFDRDINLYLKLAALQMDNWTVSSAQLFQHKLINSESTQEAIGKHFGISQHSVSRRMSRANIEEIMEVESMFRIKLKKYLS